MTEQYDANDPDIKRIKIAMCVGAATGAAVGLAVAGFCGYEAGSLVNEYINVGGPARRGAVEAIATLKLAESYVPLGGLIGTLVGGASLVLKERIKDRLLEYKIYRSLRKNRISERGTK